MKKTTLISPFSSTQKLILIEKSHKNEDQRGSVVRVGNLNEEDPGSNPRL